VFSVEIPVKFDPSPYNVPPDIVVADNTLILALNVDPELSLMVNVLILSYVNPVTYVFVSSFKADTSILNGENPLFPLKSKLTVPGLYVPPVTNLSVIPVTLKVPPVLFVNVIMSVESLYVPPVTYVSAEAAPIIELTSLYFIVPSELSLESICVNELSTDGVVSILRFYLRELLNNHHKPQ